MLLWWIALGAAVTIVGIVVGGYLGSKLADFMLDMMGGPYYEQKDHQNPNC